MSVRLATASIFSHQQTKISMTHMMFPSIFRLEYLKTVEAEEVARSDAVASTGAAPAAINRLPFYWMEIATAFLDKYVAQCFYHACLERS